jgi:ATP-dependent DNA helicase DinG
MASLLNTVSAIFSERGALSKFKEFELRPQQGRMASAIADALTQKKHFIVEAPTGVGKTLAYLVPAILYAQEAKRKAIVSTHTKNLQEQIARKDIPIVRSLLDSKFTAVVLKGRGNYLCTTRLRRALEATALLFNDKQVEQLKLLDDWSRRTTTGDLEDVDFAVDPDVWEMVASEKGVCSSQVCGLGCFFQQVKEGARQARLVVMNHALFFTLFATQESDEFFVFPNDFVILDEAHTLEHVAGVGIGKKISRYQVLSAIHKLYNPKTKKGLLAKQKKATQACCEEVEIAALEFFDTIRMVTQSQLGKHAFAKELRVRRSNIVDDRLTKPLRDLQREVEKVEATAKHDVEKAELAAAKRSLWEAETLVREFLEQPEESFTYWIELSGNRYSNVTLNASPSSIAESVAPKLFRADTSVIMTSATLAVNNSLDYFQRRIGAIGIGGMILDSPFDHTRQMSLSIVKEIPEPDADGYAETLPEWIIRSVDRSEGKALVLFTSNALMNSVAQQLKPAFDERGIRLLVQGTDYHRHELLQEFKRDISSVLFGLDSFWQGIDVPGEALEHVIITRLPFTVPNHPLIESRIEQIAQRGGNSFLEYTLPEAVLKFRQGVGRLLRSTSDRGIVTILDSRIVRKRYGRIFLNSIPKCPIDVLSENREVFPLESADWEP